MPAPGPRRVRLPAAERRERILEAATEAFSERGPQASMGEIGRAAGITRTVLYHYFPSKEVLLAAVLEEQAGAVVRALAPVIGSEGSQEERARRTIDALLGFVEHNPRAWSLLFDRRETNDPELARVYERVHRHTMSAAAVLFASDMTRAGIRRDEPRTAIIGEMHLGAIVAAARWWRAHPAIPREVVAAAAFDALWHGIAGLPERE